VTVFLNPKSDQSVGTKDALKVNLGGGDMFSSSDHFCKPIQCHPWQNNNIKKKVNFKLKLMFSITLRLISSWFVIYIID
jgi:hypothetical protein